MTSSFSKRLKRKKKKKKKALHSTEAKQLNVAVEKQEGMETQLPPSHIYPLQPSI
jgi:hypothetical protein